MSSRSGTTTDHHVGGAVTLGWFITWLISNNVGGHEPLHADPVNAWTGTLILTVALDLSAAHARGGRRRPR